MIGVSDSRRDYLEMPLEGRRDNSPSTNRTNQLIANLDHELLDVRVRAVKCLLRKLQCGIVSGESLKDRVDLLDRCKRWLLQVQETSQQKTDRGDTPEQTDGVDEVIQLLFILSKHKDFLDLLRKQSVDSLLVKLQSLTTGDSKVQLDALLNSIVCGQYELNYQGQPSEWFDNKTCPSILSSRPLEMYSSRPYNKYSYESDYRSPSRGRDESQSPRATPEATPPKKTTIPLGTEDSWIEKIPFFIPHVQLLGSDKRLMHSTLDNLSGSNESHVLMTVTFLRDTVTMDFPPEYFLQEPSILLSLGQVVVSRWTNRSIPYIACQTLLKISSQLRFRFSQLNSSEHYEAPARNPDQVSKWTNPSYEYDMYSSRMTPKPRESTPTQTDTLIENFVQLFKSFARSLLYTSYELHVWPVFDSWAFTLLKCVTIYSVDAKQLTLSIQGVLMELGHVFERKSDYQTILGLCLVSTSLLTCMKNCNETFIVSKDVRNMLRSLSYNPIIRNGWPELFQHFYQFSEMFDPAGGLSSEKPSLEEEDNPRKKVLKILYKIQNASSHDEVLDCVDTLGDLLCPIVLNSRFGGDSVSYLLVDAPWRDTFYRFLCIEPTTDGDEQLLSRVLDIFTQILQNVFDATIFKWLSPLCCEKACTTLKILGGVAVKKEITYAGAALSDLTRSLIIFYEAICQHQVLISEPMKWELFQHFVSIFHSLEDSSYSNSALLTGISKVLAAVSAHESVQGKLKETPVVCVGLIHRITDVVIVLEANGSISSGYKNSCGMYYLSVCLVHALVPLLKDENYKRFKGDWVERCGRVFNIFEMMTDYRVKTQAFQVAELLTSITDIKMVFADTSFHDSLVSLLDISYRAFIDRKYPASLKFRAGNVLLNILLDEDDRARYSFTKRLHQDHTFLIELGRMASRLMWSSQISTVVGNSASSGKSSDSMNGNGDTSFSTPRVLTTLCKILTAFINTLVEANEREGVLHEVMTSGISQILFRIVLRNPLTTEKSVLVWLNSCRALSSLIEALINLLQLDRSISIVLIGEKRSLSVVFSLLELPLPQTTTPAIQDQCDQSLNTLCGNILNLATILCCDAGNNFEDLERVAWAHQPILFSKLSSWLKITTPVISRKAAINFTHGFLSVLSHRTKPTDTSSKDNQHPFLCRNWSEEFTYGQVISEDLLNILRNSVDLHERISSMKCLSALFALSGSSVQHSVENNDLVQFCIEKLRSFGTKVFEAKGASLHGSKKVPTNLHTETLSFMELLSSVFYVSAPAKKLALRYNFADILHKIFAWWGHFPDHTLLHTYVETLLNFTEEFPEGALSLTMTSNVVGVAPRRVPTQQSLFLEMLGILEKELANVEANPSLKTVEVLFELEKNISFVQECRNVLLKSPVILFLRKLHAQETKRWGVKQNTVKINYLDFLVHITAHSDVQTCIAKIPEGLEILVQLVETEPPPGSILALKILRNLCFQPLNRGRLLSENMLIPVISNKLLNSGDLEEIETACISLWALIANYEKGRLFAKKSYCGESIVKAIESVRKMEQTSMSSDENLPRLLSLLETVQKVLGTGPSLGGSKNSLNSRSSSSSLSQI